MAIVCLFSFALTRVSLLAMRVYSGIFPVVEVTIVHIEKEDRSFALLQAKTLPSLGHAPILNPKAAGMKSSEHLFVTLHISA